MAVIRNDHDTTEHTTPGAHSAKATHRRGVRLTATAAALTLTGGVLLSSAPLPAASAQAAHTAQTSVVAQSGSTGSNTDTSGSSVATRERINDSVGALTDSQKKDLTDKIKKLQVDDDIAMTVYIVNSFGTMSGKEWAHDRYQENPQSNVLIVAFDVTKRTQGVYGGRNVGNSVTKKTYEAAKEPLAEDNPDWNTVITDKIDAAKDANDNSAALFWLGGGAIAIIAAGGGVWYMNRRRTKKQQETMVKDAQTINPDDTTSLNELPYSVLEERAQEELTSTDASIRTADDELRLAIAEFGEDRARPFMRAMDHSKRTLERAFQLRSKIDSGTVRSEEERKAMLVDIVGSCGQADRGLDKQSDEFARLRGLLIDSDRRLDELTQRIVSLRARLPQASSTLSELRTKYASDALASIADNVDIATEHLDNAERAVDNGRALTHQPAGEQGGLVEYIRTAEMTTGQADDLLTDIEQADERIAEARSNIRSLIDEITDELTEAGKLRARASTQGSQFDFDEMDAIATEAWDAVEEARAIEAPKSTSSTLQGASTTAPATTDKDDTESGSTSAQDKELTRPGDDPLAMYKRLLEADEKLDALLEQARDSDRDRNRALRVFDRTRDDAVAQIEAADSLISTRGQAVGSQARTLLSDAQRQLSHAQSLRTTDTRRAISEARHAGELGRRAEQAARNDIDDFTRRNQSYFGGGGNGGAFIAGMLISSLFHGGGHYGGYGNYGGGFGDGFGDDFGGFGGFGDGGFSDGGSGFDGAF